MGSVYGDPKALEIPLAYPEARPLPTRSQSQRRRQRMPSRLSRTRTSCLWIALRAVDNVILNGNKTAVHPNLSWPWEGHSQNWIVHSSLCTGVRSRVSNSPTLDELRAW